MSDPLNSFPVGQKIEMSVTIEKQLYFKEETSWGLFLVKNGGNERFAMNGIFPLSLVIGEEYQITGSIGLYKGEKNLKVSKYIKKAPHGKEAVLKYLKQAYGVKNSIAKAIYDVYGEKSLQQIKDNPEDLIKQVKGVGKKTAARLKEEIDSRSNTQETMLSLFDLGLSSGQIKSLNKKFGGQLLQLIRDNPYFLVNKVPNFSFEKCDSLALGNGESICSNKRIEAAILCVISKDMSNKGDCFVFFDDLIQKASSLLSLSLKGNIMLSLLQQHNGEISFKYSLYGNEYEINTSLLSLSYENYKSASYREKDDCKFILETCSNDSIECAISDLVERTILVQDIDKVYLLETYHEEVFVANKIQKIMNNTSLFKNGEQELKDELSSFLKEKNIALEDKQEEAILTFAKSKGGFFVLNGSAGCGKTFTIKIIIEMIKRQYSKNNIPFQLKMLAPTGKASKVVKRQTKKDCCTIHRGLEYCGGGFARDEDNLLEEDVFVIDETSMLSLSLTANLLKAVSVSSKVIFIGDTKQLPSIEAGNVLRDIIDSKAVPVVTLNVAKRQQADKGIIYNAHRIIEGKTIESRTDTNDSFFVPSETPENADSKILRLVDRTLDKFHFEFNEIQILCPQKKTTIGTIYLNYLMQKRFNPYPKGEKVFYTKIKFSKSKTQNLYFTEGDKVIHTKNNYSKTWYSYNGGNFKPLDVPTIVTNGECGVIFKILKTQAGGKSVVRIIVKYDDGYVFYDNDYSELDLAYALTIHKSQGSQWKAVIIPVMFANYSMLSNNLIYTAWTRASELGIVVGQERAVKYAVQTQEIQNRNTFLSQRLSIK